MAIAKHSVQDFKDAKYNVLDIGTRKVVEAFPELQRFPEFNKNYFEITGLFHEKVLKYVMLMYMDNILKRSMPDLMKRKREAALLAGFEIQATTRRFPKELEKIFLCEDMQVNQLIIRVIRLNNNNAFEQLAIYEEARARQMYKLLSPSTQDEKTKEIHDNIRRMTDDIEKLEKLLMFEEKSPNLVKALYFEIENIQLGIRPEEYAEAKRNDALDQILFDPYRQEISLKDYVKIVPPVKKVAKRKPGRPKKNAKK